MPLLKLRKKAELVLTGTETKLFFWYSTTLPYYTKHLCRINYLGVETKLVSKLGTTTFFLSFFFLGGRGGGGIGRLLPARRSSFLTRVNPLSHPAPVPSRARAQASRTALPRAAKLRPDFPPTNQQTTFSPFPSLPRKRLIQLFNLVLRSGKNGKTQPS